MPEKMAAHTTFSEKTVRPARSRTVPPGLWIPARPLGRCVPDHTNAPSMWCCYYTSNFEVIQVLMLHFLKFGLIHNRRSFLLWNYHKEFYNICKKRE